MDINFLIFATKHIENLIGVLLFNSWEGMNCKYHKLEQKLPWAQ